MVRRAYLDSSILIPLAVGHEMNQDQFGIATGVLDEVKNGEIVGVVSPLALIEVLTVLRVKKGREKHVLDKLPPDEQLMYILRESNLMYDELSEKLIRMPNIEFMEGGRRMDAIDIMIDALEILGCVTGKLQHIGNSRFRGAGTADVIHALLAQRAGCDELVTADADFEEMNGFDEFEGLAFRVLR